MNSTFRERVSTGFQRSPLAPRREPELFVRMVDTYDPDGVLCQTPVSYKPDHVDGDLFSVDSLLKSGNKDLLKLQSGISPTLFASVDAIPDDFVLTKEMLNPSNPE